MKTKSKLKESVLFKSGTFCPPPKKLRGQGSSEFEKTSGNPIY